jgi:acetyl esterase/lipase
VPIVASESMPVGLIEEDSLRPDDVIKLWDGPAPGSESWTHEETAVASFPEAVGAIRNVVVPTLTRHLPAESTDQAVVVLPGGAFHILSMDNEGHDVSRHLAANGIAAFVLKYRVVPTPADEDSFHQALREAFLGDMEAAIAATLPLAVADAERAIELVRGFGFASVAMIGFSAGGRVTSDVLTGSAPDHWPDAAGLIYTPAKRAFVAPTEAPPIFVAAAVDDPLVGTAGSMQMYDAWCEQSRPVELHLFERGGHGFGMNQQGLPVDHWIDNLLAWLGSDHG